MMRLKVHGTECDCRVRAPLHDTHDQLAGAVGSVRVLLLAHVTVPPQQVDMVHSPFTFQQGMIRLVWYT